LAFVDFVVVTRCSDREPLDRSVAENGPEFGDELRDQPLPCGLDVEPVAVTRRAAVRFALAVDEPLLDEPVDGPLDRRVRDVVAAVADRIGQVTGRERAVGTSQDGEELAFPRSELCPLGHGSSEPNRSVRPRW